jgi:uncharacterized coiled-coil DUF342 family protein
MILMLEHKSEPQLDSNNISTLHETVNKQQEEISKLKEKINGLKQLLRRAHQHISDSNKAVNETKEQLRIAKQENIELQQKLDKIQREQVASFIHLLIPSFLHSHYFQ